MCRVFALSIKWTKSGADFEMAVKDLIERLGANPVPVQLPIGNQDDFKGFVDLLEMKACYFEEDKVATRVVEKNIPDDLQDAAEEARHFMLEHAAEYSESLMEKYIEDEPVGIDEIVAGLRAGTLSGELQPVLCGSALRSMGSRKLLDAVLAYLPSPLDRPSVKGHVAGKKRKRSRVYL